MSFQPENGKIYPHSVVNRQVIEDFLRKLSTKRVESSNLLKTDNEVNAFRIVTDPYVAPIQMDWEKIDPSNAMQLFLSCIEFYLHLDGHTWPHVDFARDNNFGVLSKAAFPMQDCSAILVVDRSWGHEEFDIYMVSANDKGRQEREVQSIAAAAIASNPNCYVVRIYEFLSEAWFVTGLWMPPAYTPSSALVWTDWIVCNEGGTESQKKQWNCSKQAMTCPTSDKDKSAYWWIAGGITAVAVAAIWMNRSGRQAN